MWRVFERSYLHQTSDQQRMQIYANIRYWLSPDRALVTDEIKKRCSELDKLVEKEMIILMKKWCTLDLKTSLEKNNQSN